MTKLTTPAEHVITTSEPASCADEHAASPMQRQVDTSPRQAMQEVRLTQLKENASSKHKPNGLPSQLQAGIETLSGMDMSNVVVHRNSTKPAQLNALAYAQGHEIHLGPGQDKHLPHEAWHVAQQKQGRVRATTAAGINDDPGLEREADVMGSRAVKQAVASPMVSVSETSVGKQMPVQRQVRNVTWNTSNVDVPGHQVFNQITNNATDIDLTGVNLATLIQNTFIWHGGNAERVNDVTATTKAGRPNGAGNGTSDTSKIGQIGRDEFMLRRGIETNEAFEGGHLVSRALWDANDADVGYMNRSRNLVPMSRGLNIYSYADNIETHMSGNAWRRWTLTPEWEDYSLRERHLAELLGLPLLAGSDGDHALDFTSWLPANVNGAQGGVVRVANENPFLAPAELIDDGAKLADALRNFGLWHYLTADLQDDVENL
jgi:hypothetical protein